MRNEKIFNKFLKMLLNENTRNSNPREGILKILFYNKHVSIKEIQTLYKKIYKKSVNITTIYQTLNLLDKYNFLNTIKYSNFNKYEINLDLDHDHIVCVKCGRIVEFRDTNLLEFRKKLENEYDFMVEGHILLLEGICEKCKKFKSNQT